MQAEAVTTNLVSHKLQGYWLRLHSRRILAQIQRVEVEGGEYVFVVFAPGDEPMTLCERYIDLLMKKGRVTR